MIWMSGSRKAENLAFEKWGILAIHSIFLTQGKYEE